ncbi:MAG TPA: type II toxin-antitoxin system Phd/YefM family antitoxin [Tepidisphaeraceae bacterium]|jgi:PHD/YefM family antitoxin component YafN of YafNO toxin-antitoxin module|nr:type II toxin-antitoxin system Phd/YefM family antitoxin [Tepidisphaeraceae bacterium]
MIAAEHTQSLSEFRKRAAETIDRLNQTGEAEILTVNGEARAVLMSPAVYDALARETLHARDAAVIRRAIQQLKEGKSLDVDEFFDEVRSRLLAVKTAQAKGTHD